MITPYLSYDGIPTFRDSFIKKLFDRMVIDDTARVVFYDGKIKNRDQFLDFIKSPGVILYVAHEDLPLGCLWLTDFEGKMARTHFCFFKGIGRKQAVALAVQMANTAMANFELDMLIGFTPVWNRAALLFLHRCGAKRMGGLPFGATDENGKSYPVELTYYVR